MNISSHRPRSLIALLRDRALRRTHEVVFSFQKEGEERPATLTLGQLDRQARAIAAALGPGRRGERALLVYPPGLDYIIGLFGALYAGAIPVPVPLSGMQQALPKLRAITADTGASVALTVRPILAFAESLAALAPDLAALTWLATDDVPAELAADWQEPAVDGGAVAILQYTSGSTSAPRGVVLTHDNLLYTLSFLMSGLQAGPESRGVSWLPQHHNTGLITSILLPLYTDSSVLLMSPLDFLKQPARWLEALSRSGATHSCAPNFAYDLCVRRIPEGRRADFDLGRWRVAAAAAEPIRGETLERFAAAFAPSGFRRDAFLSCYGLAESTVVVTHSRAGRFPPTCVVSSGALREGRIDPAQPGAEPSQTLVSCGAPPEGLTVAVVDPAALTRCPADRVGEIWVAGRGVAGGYFNRQEDSTATFGGTLADTGEGPFLRTGDLGFLLDGQMYITGRLKDMIIIRGQNHYPQDIEKTVEGVHESILAGGVAAFSIEEDQQESLVIAAEVDDAAMPALCGDIRQAVAERHGLQTRAVLMLRSGALPRTASGKVQRHACREAYLAGTFELRHAA